MTFNHLINIYLLLSLEKKQVLNNININNNIYNQKTQPNTYIKNFNNKTKFNRYLKMH